MQAAIAHADSEEDVSLELGVGEPVSAGKRDLLPVRAPGQAIEFATHARRSSDRAPVRAIRLRHYDIGAVLATNMTECQPPW